MPQPTNKAQQVVKCFESFKIFKCYFKLYIVKLLAMHLLYKDQTSGDVKKLNEQYEFN